MRETIDQIWTLTPRRPGAGRKTYIRAPDGTCTSPPGGAGAGVATWTARRVDVDGPDALFTFVRAEAERGSGAARAVLRADWPGAVVDTQGRLLDAEGRPAVVARRTSATDAWPRGVTLPGVWTAAEAGRRWLALDVDGLRLPEALAAELDDTGAAEASLRVAAEFVRDTLPPEWRGARTLVQWSSSAGLAKRDGVRRWGDWSTASCRVWLWLARPVHDAVFAAEAPRLQSCGLDPAALRTVQPVYLSPPRLLDTDGRPVPDPLAGRRCVELPGAELAPVPDWLPPIEVHRATEAEARAERARKRPEPRVKGEASGMRTDGAWAALRAAWNASVDLEAELDRLCSRSADRKRWTWPGSSSAEGIHLHATEPGVWVCHHGTAPARGGDAFDLSVYLEHGGDWHRARAAAEARLGWTHPDPAPEPVPEAVPRLALTEAEAAVAAAVAEAISPAAGARVTVVRVSPGIGKSRAAQHALAVELVNDAERQFPPDSPWAGRRWAVGLRDGRAVAEWQAGLAAATRAEAEARGYDWKEWRDQIDQHTRPVRSSDPESVWQCDAHAEWSRLFGASPDAARSFCKSCDRERSFQRRRCRFMRNAGPVHIRNGVGEAVTVATVGSLLALGSAAHPDGAAPGPDVVILDESPLDQIMPALEAGPAEVSALVDAGAVRVTRSGEPLDGAAVVAEFGLWADGTAPDGWTWTIGPDLDRIMAELAGAWPRTSTPPAAGLPAAAVAAVAATDGACIPRRAPDARDDGPTGDRWTWTVPGWAPLDPRWSRASVVVLDATATASDAMVVASAIGGGLEARTVRLDAEWADGTRVILADADSHRLAVGDREGHPQRAPRAAWATVHARAEAELPGPVLHLTHQGLRDPEQHPAAAAVVGSWRGRTMHYGEAGARGTNTAEACQTVVMDTRSVPRGVTAAWAAGLCRRVGLDADTAQRDAAARACGEWVQALHRVRPHRAPRTLVILGRDKWARGVLAVAGVPEATERWTAADLDDWTAERSGSLDGVRNVRGWLVRWIGRNLTGNLAVEGRTDAIPQCIENNARARMAGGERACPASIDGALRLLWRGAKGHHSGVWEAIAAEAVAAGWTMTPVSTDAGGYPRWFAHRVDCDAWPEAVAATLAGEGRVWWKCGGDGRRRWLAPPQSLVRFTDWLSGLPGRPALRLVRSPELATDYASATRPEAAPDTRRRTLAREALELAEYLDCAPAEAWETAARLWHTRTLACSRFPTRAPLDPRWRRLPPIERTVTATIHWDAPPPPPPPPPEGGRAWTAPRIVSVWREEVA